MNSNFTKSALKGEFATFELRHSAGEPPESRRIFLVPSRTAASGHVVIGRQMTRSDDTDR